MNLRAQLQKCFAGRVCLMGLGNVEYGDDGFGVRLAELFANRGEGSASVLIAGTEPERFIGRAGEFDCVIFLDAVDFGGPPGATVFLNADQITARFPQISTHKISLGLLAKQMESNGATKVWLLGVQPKSIKPRAELSPEVQGTLELLLELLIGANRCLTEGNEGEPRMGADLQMAGITGKIQSGRGLPHSKSWRNARGQDRQAALLKTGGLREKEVAA